MATWFGSRRRKKPQRRCSRCGEWHSELFVIPEKYWPLVDSPNHFGGEFVGVCNKCSEDPGLRQWIIAKAGAASNPPVDDIEWFNMSDAERDAVIAESYAKLRADAANANVIQLNSLTSLNTVIIHPSTHEGEAGMWQISWLDDAGVPSMHETAKTREEALFYMAGGSVGGFDGLSGQAPHAWFVSGKR